MEVISLTWLDKTGIANAQKAVTAFHYLHQPVHNTASPRGYAVMLESQVVGYLLFGRPEATRVNGWYGGVEDVKSGKAEVTRWQIINLARVWLDPVVQAGGAFYSPEYLPGYTDRKKVFRSTLASQVGGMALERIAFDFLLEKPPCFLDEPYHIDWCLSYCDTRYHRGTLYKASGFELYRENGKGIQTWRKRLAPMTAYQDQRVVQASLTSARSNEYRAKRQQLAMSF